MLVSSDRSTVVSSFGWVDHGALWAYCDSNRSIRSIRLGAAKYLDLRPGVDDYFAVVHNAEADAVEITVHRFPEVDVVLARAVVGDRDSIITGDINAFTRVPRYYTASFKTSTWTDFGLITVDVPGRRIFVSPFPWFDNGSYDKGYQGIVGVTEIPNSHLLLVSVQRSSTVVMHDPTTSNKVGEVKIGNGGGNPTLYFRRTVAELWADDYDTLVRLDTNTWHTLNRRRLQGAAPGSRQFIGKFSIDAAEELCAVARPFSRDVVAIDMATFTIKFVANMPGQPLETAMLSENRVIARDWKTGVLLNGEFRRKWWWPA